MKREVEIPPETAEPDIRKTHNLEKNPNAEVIFRIFSYIHWRLGIIFNGETLLGKKDEWGAFHNPAELFQSLLSFFVDGFSLAQREFSPHLKQHMDSAGTFMRGNMQSVKDDLIRLFRDSYVKDDRYLYFDQNDMSSPTQHLFDGLAKIPHSPVKKIGTRYRVHRAYQSAFIEFVYDDPQE